MKLIRSVAFGIAVTAGIAGLSHSADAEENGVVNYAPGAPGPFLGFLPPVPGLFLLNQAFFSPTAPLYGADGKKSPLPISGGSEGVTERFIPSYGTFYGATLYSQVVVPLVNVSTNTFGVHDSEFNVANITVSPLISTFHLDQANSITVGFDIATQLGSYKSSRPLNVALNYTSFQPVAVYRYFDPHGFTAAVGERLLFNTTNNDTQYRSGSTSVTEFDIGYNVANFRLGAVGAFTQQFEDDRQFGIAVPGGNRLETLAVGPSVLYNIGPVLVNVNYQFNVLARNTLKSDTLWVNLALPLYTPPRPEPSVVTARY